MSVLRRRHFSNRGFTLIEGLVAAMILVVALVSVGLMAAQMMTGTGRSKYVSTATVLASEKLEDLNRWSPTDPQICVPTASGSAGSLSADINQTTTCPAGTSAAVNYYDDVYPNLTNGSTSCLSASTGCFAETISSVAGGVTTYTTTVHSPNGIVQSSTSTTPPSGPSFHRRWLIESNTPLNGVRRITVKVTSTDVTVKPAASFQMSIVRP